MVTQTSARKTTGRQPVRHQQASNLVAAPKRPVTVHPQCTKCRRPFLVTDAKKAALEMYQDPDKKAIVKAMGEADGKFWESMCGYCIRDLVQTRARSSAHRCKDCGKLYKTEYVIATMADYAKDQFIIDFVIKPLSKTRGKIWECMCLECFIHEVDLAREDAEGLTFDLPLD